MKSKYIGFYSHADMLGQFAIEADKVSEAEIILARYDTGDYDGEAFVLYRRDDKLYEVHASHCSCFGLEHQWEPEETTIEALAMRKGDIYAGTLEAIEAAA